MPFWGWALLIAVLSGFLVAAVLTIVHHTRRRMPARQVPEGDATDISAPLPMHVHEEQDVMTERETAREHDAEREHEQPRAKW